MTAATACNDNCNADNLLGRDLFSKNQGRPDKNEHIGDALAEVGRGQGQLLQNQLPGHSIDPHDRHSAAVVKDIAPTQHRLLPCQFQKDGGKALAEDGRQRHQVHIALFVQKLIQHYDSFILLTIIRSFPLGSAGISSIHSYSNRNSLLSTGANCSVYRRSISSLDSWEAGSFTSWMRIRS